MGDPRMAPGAVAPGAVIHYAEAYGRGAGERPALCGAAGAVRPASNDWANVTCERCWAAYAVNDLIRIFGPTCGIDDEPGVRASFNRPLTNQPFVELAFPLPHRPAFAPSSAGPGPAPCVRIVIDAEPEPDGASFTKYVYRAASARVALATPKDDTRALAPRKDRP